MIKALRGLKTKADASLAELIKSGGKVSVGKDRVTVSVKNTKSEQQIKAAEDEAKLKVAEANKLDKEADETEKADNDASRMVAARLRDKASALRQDAQDLMGRGKDIKHTFWFNETEHPLERGSKAGVEYLSGLQKDE